MILGVFLSIGESWEDLVSHGQDQLFLENNLHFYSRNFEKVFVFSYGLQSGPLGKNIELIGMPFLIHRYIYAFLLPIIHWELVKKCTVYRGMQLTGGIPSLISKYLFKKSVVINYGYDYQKYALIDKKALIALAYDVLSLVLVPRADAVIVTTEVLKKYLSRFTQKIYLIPNSVNTRTFSPAKNRHTEKYILSVGRLENQKNYTMLIDAVASMRRKIKIKLIGKGVLKSKLLKKAHMKNVDLEIIDVVPNNKLPTYYNECSMFILPSLKEGHPKALIEAMSCGAPVIGSNVEGINSMIHSGKNGILISSTRELSNAIQKLASNRKLAQKLGQNARKDILRKFDSASVWRQEISLLKNIAN